MAQSPNRSLRAFGWWARLGFVVPILLLTAQAAKSDVGSRHDRLANDVRALLFSMTTRVADYADWHFGWVSNYRSGYTIAAHVLFNKSKSIVFDASDPGIFETAEVYYNDALRRRVILPVRFSNQLQKLAFDRLALSLADDDRAFAEHPCASDPSSGVCKSASNAIGQIRDGFLDKIFVETVSQQTFSPDRLLNLDKNVVFNIHRAYRPLVIRTGIFIVRFTEMASILLFLTGAIRGLFGIPNSFILVSIISLLLIYTVDYSFSRIDALLNQKTFETVLISEILKQESYIVQYLEDWERQQIIRYSEWRHDQQSTISQGR
jgi:hypothetical protein